MTVKHRYVQLDRPFKLPNGTPTTLTEYCGSCECGRRQRKWSFLQHKAGRWFIKHYQLAEPA